MTTAVPSKVKVFMFVPFLILFIHCQAERNKMHEERADIMGTVFTVKIDDRSHDPRQAAREAFEEIRRIDRLLSTYKNDSEISEVNRRAAAEKVHVGTDFWNVAVASGEFFRLSEGSFDPTVRPLMHLWKSTTRQGRLPTREELSEVLGLVGFGNVHLDESGHTVAFAVSGMSLDFGGIAKGYAVDRAIDLLKELGITNAIVDAGGNFRTIGMPSARKSWQIGIRNPLRHDEIIARLPLPEKAAATSGNYERYFEVEGKRYCHIMDPRTGWPAQGVLSVTVTADTAMTADALSTSVFVLGKDKGMQLIEHLPEAECVMIFPAETSPEDFQILVSSGLKDTIELLVPASL